jgi:hypothetical protein
LATPPLAGPSSSLRRGDASAAVRLSKDRRGTCARWVTPYLSRCCMTNFCALHPAINAQRRHLCGGSVQTNCTHLRTRRLELARVRTHGRRQVESNIATVLLVLAGASRLGGGRIRSPTHASVASISASTPNIRRMPTVSRDNVRIRDSTGPPPRLQRPPLRDLSVNLSFNVIIWLYCASLIQTALGPWITCRADQPAHACGLKLKLQQERVVIPGRKP